jgi:hypothetical protein
MPLTIPWRDREKRRRKSMPRMPTTVRGREVVFGSGYAAAAYCAGRRAKGMAPPVVFEQNLATGGVFSQLLDFKLNSEGQASVASVQSPGPSRVVPFSDIDDLNWIPNSDHQVSQYGAFEYPRSYDMCKAIARSLKDYAEVYTGVTGLTFSRSGQVRMADGTNLGTAKRVIWAGGLMPKNDYVGGPAVMSGYDFMKTPPPELHNLRLAVVGSGDTAAQCVEYMLGQGLVSPTTKASEIHWYGDASMPLNKAQWEDLYHTRFSGLARHFPQQLNTERSVIRPYAQRGIMINLGRTAMVNQQVYNMVVMAIGFRPAPCPVTCYETYRVGGMDVARCNSDETIDGVPMVFKIGTAAGVTPDYKPFRSRFPAAKLAMYVQGPLIAALAAVLP